jgi:RNA ligase (TIGR02306 family)
VTFYFKDELFGVCSRNLDLKETEDNLYWKMARQLDIENKLKSIGSYAIQGEIYGNGIQKNKYKLKDVFFACFNIFDIENQTYLNLQELKNMSLQLNIPLVPIINENFKLPNTLDDLLKYVSGPSTLNPSSLREGSVFRPLIEKEVRGLGRLSFKAVSNEFLLKHGD